MKSSGLASGFRARIIQVLTSVLLPTGIALAILAYLGWENFTALPWWDEFGVTAFPGNGTGIGFFLPQNFPYENFMGHPPVFPFFLWLANTLTGELIPSVRLVSFAWMGFLLYGIARITRHLSGLAAVWILLGLVCLSPAFIWASTFLSSDISYAACGFFGLYLLVAREDRRGAAIFLSFSVLLRESGLAFLTAAFLSVLLKHKRSGIRDFLFLLLPFFLFLSHFAIVYLRYGQISVHILFEKGKFQENFQNFGIGKLPALETSLWMLFRHFSPWIVYPALLFPFLRSSDRKTGTLILVLSAAGAFISVFFTIYEDILPRDFYPFYLLLLIFFSAWIGRLFRVLPGSWKAVALLPLLLAIHDQWSNFREVEAIWYRDKSAERTAALKDLGSFIQEHFRDSPVVAPFPVREVLEWTSFGYVTHPLKVVSTFGKAELLVECDEKTVPRTAAAKLKDRPHNLGNFRKNLLFAREMADGTFVRLYSIREGQQESVGDGTKTAHLLPVDESVSKERAD